MAYGAKIYTFREESTESGASYFISFKDGQGEHHELEVSELIIFIEFRQMEPRNRNLQQWSQRHRVIDKVFALCDYYLSDKVDRHSRHLYDIYKILEHTMPDTSLSGLVQ